MGTWLKKRFEKNRSPGYITVVITKNKHVNPFGLALQLKISEGETRSLLRYFAYQYHVKMDKY